MSKLYDRLKKVIDRGDTVVEVTCTRTYFIPPERSDGRTDEEIVKEFFQDFDLNRHHASRNAAEIGGGTKILAIRSAHHDGKVVNEKDHEPETPNDPDAPEEEKKERKPLDSWPERDTIDETNKGETNES